jgi:hypothetical protein
MSTKIAFPSAAAKQQREDEDETERIEQERQETEDEQETDDIEEEKRG